MSGSRFRLATRRTLLITGVAVALLTVLNVSARCQKLLDNYGGVGDLTYTTDGTWVNSGGQREGQTGGSSAPDHSYSSYDLSQSVSGWNLQNANANAWFGWMDLNRTSVSGWGASDYSCGMVLAADDADFNAATTTGYAIGFRDSDDYLVVFRFSAGIVSGTTELPETSTIIVDSGYTYADGDNGVNFYVELLSDGKWKVYYKVGAKLSDADAVDKTQYTDGSVTSASADTTYRGTTYKYSGWIYAHSSGASEKAYFGNFGAGGLASEPTTQASGVSFSNVGGNAMTISFTAGNSASRVVLVKQGSAVDSNPVDGVTYTGSATFGSGSQIGTGNYVAYVGSGTSFTLGGLSANTAYYAAVYEFNGSDGSENYLTTSPATASGSTTYGEVAQYPLGQSPSGGWPADNAWQALSTLNDANNGANQLFDFVGDTSNPCGYWAQNSSYVFFRMRVQTHSVSATTYNGLGTLWVYIDTNSDNIADCSFAWDKKSNDDANHGLEGQKLKKSGGTWDTLEMKDLDNNEGTKGVEDINGNGRTGEGYVRSIDGQTTDNFGTTTFIDFAVSWAYLRTYSTTGLNTGQTWRIAFGSGDEKLDFEPPNLDVAGGANPSSSTSVGWSGSFAPTAVVLLQLQAVTVNGQVTVRWSTSSETDTAGFDLYRLVDGQWLKLNDTLIPSQGWPNGGIGASYSVADPTAKPGETYTYKLVERTTDGQSIEYGPYDRTVSPFITTTFAMTPQGFKLKWLSRTGEKYRVLKRTDLRSGQYVPIAENLAATPPENEYVDPVATGAAFYRIELQP